MTCHLRGGESLKPSWNKPSADAAPTTFPFATSLASVAATQPPHLASMIGFIADCDARASRRHRRATFCAGGPLPPEPPRSPQVSVSPTPTQGRRITPSCALCGNPRLERHHRHPESQRPARHGRRRLSHRHQVGDRAQRARARESTSSATPTRASPAPSKTASSWRTCPIW